MFQQQTGRFWWRAFHRMLNLCHLICLFWLVPLMFFVLLVSWWSVSRVTLVVIVILVLYLRFFFIVIL